MGFGNLSVLLKLTENWYVLLIYYVQKEKNKMVTHNSSIIHPSAEIDDDVSIGPFCVIGKNVKIKSGTKLLSHVVLKGPTTIAENIFFISFAQLVKILQIKSLKVRKQLLRLVKEIYLGRE